jgi:hypothetical protein
MGKDARASQQAKSTSHPAEEIEIIRLGKDEMNLVEYPFAALRREEGAPPIIEFEWENRHPVSKKPIKASWRVSGDPVWGLPTAADERVYLVLMELSREGAFDSPTVHFSCYDVLKRLEWPDNQKHYDMLRTAFERLKSVSIITRNAFWNHAHKSFVNSGFSLIEVYEILAEKPGRKKSGQRHLPTSYFKWNDVIFASMQAGFLKSLDLDLALSLQSSIALRLYRYLDKKSYDGRRTFEIELSALCERHLGMRPNPYPSKYKERLRPAHAELLARGFLENVAFEPMKTKKGEKACYTFALKAEPLKAEPLKAEPAREGVQPRLSAPSADPPGIPGQGPYDHPEAGSAEGGAWPIEGAWPSERAGEGTHENGAGAEAEALLQRMLAIGVSPHTARELHQTADPGQLALQLDCLQDREPRNPAATFVKAVRELWALPHPYVERMEALERARKEREAAEAQEAAKAAQKRRAADLRASQEAEAAQLDAHYERLDERNRQRVDEEAVKRLGIVAQMGKAEGALRAMRRNVIRELLDGASG